MKNSIRVFLIDDDRVFRYGTKGLLEKTDDISLVNQADSGEYALTLLKEEKPDILLVDLHLGGNGLEGPPLISELKKHDPTLPCISLTIEDNPFLLLQLLDAGTDAIIRKTGIDIIKKTIREVFAGGHIIQPEIAFDIIQALQERQIVERLTPAEADTFRRMGTGEDDHSIAKAGQLSESTIKSRLVTLKRKLNVKTKADVIMLYQRFFPWDVSEG